MIVDPRVLKELILNKKIPTVRAERVVALFVDLRGFTTLCEKESPQEVNLTLNEYLEVVTKAVQDHGGVIDKFVGDEVMALWGVPEQAGSDPKNAVRSAVSIRRRLRDLNIVRKRAGRDELAVGIGLHCGPAIVGPVGSAERIDFTAIGPTINLAARLQSLTKEKKSDILISSDLYQLVTSSALVTDLGPIKIRGMEKPVTLYRVLGVTDDSGKMHIHDKILESAELPSTPGIATDAPDNLFKAS
jgi:adenylate cyclase